MPTRNVNLNVNLTEHFDRFIEGSTRAALRTGCRVERGGESGRAAIRRESV